MSGMLAEAGWEKTSPSPSLPSIPGVESRGQGGCYRFRGPSGPMLTPHHSGTISPRASSMTCRHRWPPASNYRSSLLLHLALTANASASPHSDPPNMSDDGDDFMMDVS